MVGTARCICSRNRAFRRRRSDVVVRWRSTPRGAGPRFGSVADILLLDEPTNHLDLPGIEWLERELAGLRAGIVLISHDRRLLERFSRSTEWLDRGVTRVLDRGFSAFKAWREAVLAQEADEQHKLGRKIAMEEDWRRYGVMARRTRNQRPLAELHALRRERRAHRGATGTARLEAAQADLSGRLVAAAEGISKAYGDLVVVRNFSVRIIRRDRVGIVEARLWMREEIETEPITAARRSAALSQRTFSASEVAGSIATGK
jgi:ATPase subunit of ABC transporter with duplicated ATPase domains